MQGFREHLAESSLSRLWRHNEKHQCGAISGWRGGNTKEENAQNNREIKAVLRRRGYGVTHIDGNYIENFGTDDAKEVGEDSFFVVDLQDTGNLEKDLAALGKRFDQDSVLIIPKGGKGAYLLGTNGSDFPGMGNTITVGNSRYGRAAGEFLSRVKGRAFAFEAVEAPQTRNGLWAEKALAEQVEDELNADV